uniref:Esterase n=2 Tax=Mycobacterium riyadhense TaxID=486698 RepID=A0A653EUD3_9MYCO|nr:Putative esterase [Mycobacterium riyadhense]
MWLPVSRSRATRSIPVSVLPLRSGQSIHRHTASYCCAIVGSSSWSRFGLGLPPFQLHGYHRKRGNLILMTEVTRADRFIKTAVEILGETGRTDFTVQEVVARSKTSLRAFYQHFSSKDELLLALFDRTIAQSVQVWRAETAGLDSTAALKLVFDRVGAQPETTTQDSLNRALSLYNQHLAETRPREYARVLSPLHRLIHDIVVQGITEGVFSPGLDVGAAAAIVMQTMVGALRLRWLGTELNGSTIDTGQLYDFCSRALGIRDTDGQSATPSLAELFAQIGMRPATGHGDEFAMTMPVSPQVVNTSGALQGGLLATLADVAGGQLGLEYLQPGTAMTTADLAIRYLRPIRQGSALAVPRVLRAGRRSLVMQIDIFGDSDSDSELAATATVNFAIVKHDGAPVDN